MNSSAARRSTLSSGYLQTGQTTCHDSVGRLVNCAGSGQDAEHSRGRPWPEPRFEMLGNAVLDRLTGLMWSRNAAPAEFPLTWNEAFAFVDGLNCKRRFGHDDWRLPNRRELRSLISHQTRRPALPQTHPFEQVFAGWYWSATTAVISPAHAWYVDLDGGRMFFGGKDQSFMVWPVRGHSAVLPRTGQLHCYDDHGRIVPCDDSTQDGELRLGNAWPQTRFAIRNDSVLDRLTGLYWRRSADLEDSAQPWDTALERVARLSRRSGSAWRLPNINELESLLDCAQHSPALPADHPFTELQEVYWSSTTSLYQPDWAWALYLDKGAVGVGQKQEARFYTWAVKDADPAGRGNP